MVHRENTARITAQPVLEFVFYGMMMLLPFHGFFTIWISSLVGSELLVRSWVEVLMLVLFVGLVWQLAKQTRLRRTLKDPAILLPAAYIVFVLLYCLVFALHRHGFTTANYIGLVIDVRFFAFFILAFMVFSLNNDPRRSQNIMYYLVLVPATLVAFMALLQAYILPKDILKHFGFVPPKFNAVLKIDNNSNFVRVRSFLRGPNELGAYLITPFLLAIAYLHSLREKNQRLVLCGVLGLASLAVFVSYSRSAWIGLIVAVVAYFTTPALRIIQRIIRSTPGKLVAIVVAIGLVLATSMFARSDTFHIIFLHDDTHNTIIGSTTVRINSFAGIKQDTLEHPYGSGPGTSGPASVYGRVGRIPDNYYVQIAQEYGFAGIVLFIGINAYVAWRLLRMRHNMWAKVALVALVGLAITNLFLHNWADDTVALFFWGYAGWVFGTHQPDGERVE